MKGTQQMADTVGNLRSGEPTEIAVMARALAEWSSPQYRWEARHPNNREHWLNVCRTGYEAMAAKHLPEGRAKFKPADEPGVQGDG